MKTIPLLVVSIFFGLALGAVSLHYNRPEAQTYSLIHGGKRALDPETLNPTKFTLVNDRSGLLRLKNEKGHEIIIGGDYVLVPYEQVLDAWKKHNLIKEQ